MHQMKRMGMLAALAVSSLNIVSAAPDYTVVASFQVESSKTQALGVSEQGHIVGGRRYTGTVTEKKRTRTYEGVLGVLTSAEGLDPISVLPVTGTGIAASGRYKGQVFASVLTGIASDGSVAVGTATFSSGTGTSITYFEHAALYKNGVWTDLGALGSTANASIAAGVNAAGLVVGTSNVDRRTVHAFSYLNGTRTDLGTLGGRFSSAFAVNDNDVIVGGSTLSTGVLHPFSYSGGTMTDLGLPTDIKGANAVAISSNDQIAVVGSTNRLVKSFLYVNGTYIDVGSLYTKNGKATPVQAAGVNADGVIVGSTLNASGKSRAFIYSDGALSDLNDDLPTDFAGWTIVSATGISDSGYISAIAVDATNKSYAILLRLESITP